MSGKAFLGAVASAAVLLIFPPAGTAQNLVHVGAYDSLVNALSVTVADSYAYVGDYVLGMVILDISEPSEPALVGAFNPWPAVFDIDVSNDTAFLATGSSEPYIGILYSVDVSDKAHPDSLGSITFASELYAVAVRPGSYAFVANGGAGVQAVDISRPDSLFLISTLVTPGTATGLDLHGYLYVAARNAGLLIVDVSDPHNMSIMGTCDTPGNAYDVSVGNLPRGYAYVADGQGGMQVIDIHNAQNPHIVGSLPTPDNAIAINSYGSYTYIAVEDSGLIVARTSDPAEPILIDSAHTSRRAQGVYREYYYTYLANGQSLDIYSFNLTDCRYIPGDPNGNGSPNGLDVTYSVAFFKGGPPPVYSCVCPPHGQFFVAGDVNGSCSFNGMDVTYMVRYSYGDEQILFCPDCPPIR
jgi:hypothetical protein